jgi:hypothetical protein
MKQKDIILIIVVVFISGVLSLVISNSLISSSKNRGVRVEVVDAISAEFPLPSDRYFNANSFDPTQLITIGSNNNQKPFNQPAR